ncbi:hypothetical protein OK016_23445 [Vibrio chagasii]|nr:hypothetical protein [Vibrio chagasii]
MKPWRGIFVLIDGETGEEVGTQISADGSNIKIQCESGLKAGTTYSICCHRWEY